MLDLVMQRFGALNWTDLRLEATGSRDGACGCCGTTTRRLWGFVHHEHATVAAYFVDWTAGKSDHGAAVDLILGAWGPHATPEQRFAVSLEYRVGDHGRGFGVVDAVGRPHATNELVGRALNRSEVRGAPLAKLCFAIVDAIWMNDARINEVRAWK